MPKKMICRACGKDAEQKPTGFCARCSVDLSYGELLTVAEARESRLLLKDILIRLEHMTTGTQEVARLASAMEQLARVVKPQADAFDDIAGEVRRVVKEVERRMRLADEEGEDWRGGDK